MLALSIRQPWASLILKAGKDIENRDWPTKFRGRILIHAAKGCTRDEWENGNDPLWHCGGPTIELPALADGQPSAPVLEALAQQVISFVEGLDVATMTPASPDESGAAAPPPGLSALLLVGGASDQAQALDPGSPTEFETSVAEVPTPPKGTDLEH